MRQSELFFVTMAALLVASAAVAEDTADAPAAGDELAWDQFDDPSFDPATAEAPTEAMPAEAARTLEAGMDEVADSADEAIEATDDGMAFDAEPVAEPATEIDATVSDSGIQLGDSAPIQMPGIILGPQGIDDQGRTGRLHTVANGDTLWDLSAAYLGTPWVWPSVWIDNDDIANPHLILPGDKIWITANEMRVVSDAEAESFLAPVVEEMAGTSFDEDGAFDSEPLPEMVDTQPLAALETTPEDPSTLEAFPVAVVDPESAVSQAGRLITISRRDSYGFVSDDDLTGASSIVESSSERTFLSAGDPVYLGLGEGDAEVGDQFMVFQVVDEVRDVDTNRILGHHVENLGWIEVTELTGDSSIGEIRQSYAEIRRGASIIAREKLSRRVAVRHSPDAIEGQVVFLPSDRTLMADGGYVYLNRGEFHGLEIGTELEVVVSGEILNERERRVDVRTPDAHVATLVVVTVEPETSVAFVLNSSREIAVGDTVRPVVARSLASR